MKTNAAHTLGRVILFFVVLLISFSARSFGDDSLNIDRSRMRDVEQWKPQIQKYSMRHYGQNTYTLDPKCIVLHYTAMPEFPWNLVKSKEFSGEAPGLASHYVIEGKKVWQILPDTIRSRGCYGMNHVAINIEMCALDSVDLASKKQTMRTCAILVKNLMNDYQIDISKVYSHQQVARMDKKIVPEVLDFINSKPYHKIDPGEGNMRTIKKMIENLRSGEYGEY